MTMSFNTSNRNSEDSVDSQTPLIGAPDYSSLKTYWPILSNGLFLLFCASTALQSVFNSWAAGDALSTGEKCDVGELSCYIEPKGQAPFLSILFIAFTLIANIAIPYVFLPIVADKVIKIFNKENRCKQSVIWPLIFALATVVAFYELSRSSFKFSKEWVNITLILLAVVPAFCSRFVGAYELINSMWRNLPYLSSFFSKEHPLLMVRLENDIKRNLYRLNTSSISDITSVFYGENRSYMAEGAYLAAQIFLFLICAASSLIICNINLKLTTGLLSSDRSAFLRIPVAAIPTAPGIVYYIYSLNGLPDRMLRTYGLAQRVNECQVWALLVLVYIVGLGSCGNLLYSGLTGDFSRLLPSFPGQHLILGTVGGAISSLCNIFALLKIFEDHVKMKLSEDDRNHFQTLEQQITTLVTEAKNARQTIEGGYSPVNLINSVNNANSEEPQEEVDCEEAQAKMKNIFLPFFQRLVSCEKPQLYEPLLNYDA